MMMMMMDSANDTAAATTTAATTNNVITTATATANDNTIDVNAITIIPGTTRMQDQDGYIGTIEYVGPVASAKDPQELYAGIVWDDPSRGKHDGSVICRRTNQLVRHFSCPPFSPTMSTRTTTTAKDHDVQYQSSCRASFVRLSKVDLGVHLTPDVVRQKYVPQEEQHLVAPNNILPHSVTTSRGHAKPIEFYGELQIRSRQQVQDLNVISLRRMGIARYAPSSSPPPPPPPPPSSASASPPSSSLSLQKEFQHLTELDLAGNLLADWDTVIRIMNDLPQLLHLSVACNRIRNPSAELLAHVIGVGGKDDDDDDDNKREKKNASENDGTERRKTSDTTMQQQQQPLCFHQPPFTSLQLLNVNQCGITSVQTLLWIGTLLPQLQHLCLAHANLQSLEESFASKVALQLSNLHHLDLTNCQLQSWQQQIVPLASTLPHLQDLTLDDNPISNTTTTSSSTSSSNAAETTIITATTFQPIMYFPQLQSLQLTGTQIASWQAMDGLTHIPTLTNLRWRHCPLLDSLGTGEARAITIARLEHLTKLNASPITRKERTEAERRYVSSVACQLLQLPLHDDCINDNETTTTTTTRAEAEASLSADDGAGNRQAFLKNHPAFEHLMEKHRDAIASTMETSSSLSSGGGHDSCRKNALVVINVSIQSMAASSCHQEPLVRRLPGTLPIKRLKAMCARSFGLDPDLQRLHFCTELDAFPSELDDDEHTLAYYGVSDGSIIYMNEIDVEAMQRQEERAIVEQNAKFQEQEALEMHRLKHKKKLVPVQQQPPQQ